MSTTDSTTDPDEIRARIERTHTALSSDVDALTEKVSPGRVVARRVDRVRHGLTSMKDTVMGTTANAASHTASAVGGTADSAGSAVAAATDRVSDAASGAADAISQAPRMARQQTRGNPLAAGLIAFGAGWLISSLLPSSRKEQQLVEQATDRIGDQLQPAVDQVKQAASEVADNLRQPVSEAVDQVRSTAADAASTVADEGRSATRQVADRTQEARSTVTEDVPGPRR